MRSIQGEQFSEDDDPRVIDHEPLGDWYDDEDDLEEDEEEREFEREHWLETGYDQNGELE